MTTNQDIRTDEPRQRHRRDGGDRYLVLRNVLNIIFMLGALAGVLVYFYGDQDAGTVVECVFRFMK